jgi:2-polyprenyl-3-methyl-5-hydroxy-6-metoxy-1,4-benzoquinol methylase
MKNFFLKPLKLTKKWIMDASPLKKQADLEQNIPKISKDINKKLDSIAAGTLKQWAKEPDDSMNFASLSYVNELSLKKIGGQKGESVGLWDYMLNLYTKKDVELNRVLSLCCGFGHAERLLATLRKFRFCDAYDVVPEALNAADRLAKEAGIYNISYEIMDLNNISLHHKYDLVISGGIHHIKNLEQLFSEVSSHLTPNGIFLMYEYVGPSQCQPTQRQVEIINTCIRLIPPVYRVKISSQRELNAKNPEEALHIIQEKNLDLDKHLWTSFTPMTREQWDVHDPSEAVRSDEIIPLLKKYFDMVDARYTLGSIIQFSLYDIAGNFSVNTQETRDILDMLLKIEDVAVKYDDVPEDYAVIVVRNNAKEK